MTRQYKLARKMKKIALTTAAKELEVSQPTLSNWESGRKDPSIDSLVRMSRYYGVTTDFLLGLTTDSDPRKDWVFPINPDILPALHETPVFPLKMVGPLLMLLNGNCDLLAEKSFLGRM